MNKNNNNHDIDDVKRITPSIIPEVNLTFVIWIYTPFSIESQQPGCNGKELPYELNG